MKTETEIPYFTQSDYRTIQAAIEQILSINNHIPARVSFYPRGEGLFFHNAWKDKAYVYAPHFTSELADIYVVRESRYTPPWQQSRSEQYVNAVPPDAKPVIARDESEIWFIYQAKSANHTN